MHPPKTGIKKPAQLVSGFAIHHGYIFLIRRYLILY